MFNPLRLAYRPPFLCSLLGTPRSRRCYRLVLAGNRLACFLHRAQVSTIIHESGVRTNTTTYQLLQIPTTDLHIALVLVQAPSERLGILLTIPRSPAAALIRPILGLARHGAVGRLRLGGGAGPASKEAPNRVADRTPDCDAAAASLAGWTRKWNGKARWRGRP